jgi:hypothetical protein
MQFRPNQRTIFQVGNFIHRKMTEQTVMKNQFHIAIVFTKKIIGKFNDHSPHLFVRYDIMHLT